MDGAIGSPEILIALALTAFLTSVLSAVIGMAGGVTLLGVMLLFLDPLVVIPIHGVIQLVSNSTRVVVQRAHIERSLVLRYAIPLFPMGFVGLALAEQLPPAGTKAMIGCFVLLATWLPKLLLLGRHPEDIDPNRRFFVLGAVVGVINMAIGATGPLIAPFFLNLGLTRFALIGTKAACQSLGHLAKIAVFGIAGFAFADYWLVMATMIPMVVLGTQVGSRVLHRVNERAFTVLYKSILTLVAVRLVVMGFWG
jgi:uncharacterized membrane protein YfcA